MTRTILVGVVLVFLAAAAWPGSCPAADFRVENSVYVDDQPQPATHSSTIFHHGVVYDFLDHPAEVIIFDLPGSRFILLDVDRKLRTDLHPTAVRQTVDQLTRLAENNKDKRTRFLWSPTFEQTVDEKTGELVFESPWMSYRVQGVRPDSEEIVRQYHEFSDWSARLNTFLRPGGRPTLARLIIHEALARRGEIPGRVVLTLKLRAGLGVQDETFRGEHRLVKRLVESDLRRVAQAGEQMAAFKPVSFREYEEDRREQEAAEAKARQ